MDSFIPLLRSAPTFNLGFNLNLSLNVNVILQPHRQRRLRDL
jgi:hypothetical protein